MQKVKLAVENVLDCSGAALDRVAGSIVDKFVEVEASPVEASAPRPVRDGTPYRQVSSLDELTKKNKNVLGYNLDTRWTVPNMRLEMAAGSVGAATFMCSAMAQNNPGMVVGYGLATVVKGVLLWTDLGRPDRVWRVFAKPGTSWIARGSWAFAGFGVAGALSILSELTPVDPLTKTFLSATAGVSGAIVLLYDGLFLNDSQGVEPWLPKQIPAWFVTGAAGTGVLLAQVLGAKIPYSNFVGSALLGLSAYFGKSYKDEIEAMPGAGAIAAQRLEAPLAGQYVTGSLLAGGVLPAVFSALPGGSKIGGVIAAALGATGVYATRKVVLNSGIHSPVI